MKFPPPIPSRDRDEPAEALAGDEQGQEPKPDGKGSPQSLLILEDDPFYAELLTMTVSREWPGCRIVASNDERSFRAALENNNFDLILSDYSMPQFSGMEALGVAREKNPEIPFVVVSGSILDNVGVESLKAGATDYVLKDRIARLVPAIRRALNELEESRHRRKAESAHQDSETLKSAILDAALDCIIVMDEAGKIIEFNPAAEATFGHRSHEVLGRTLLETIIPAGLREPYRERLRPIPAGQPTNGFNERTETTGLRADGSEFPLEIAIVPIQLKSRLVYTAYLRNITERKQAEAKLKEVSVQLEESNRDLRRRNQEIQNFYHTLSHELKTPLTSAREFVSIVMDGLAGQINQTQTEYLGIAKESCDQLQLCINDLLDATRLDTGKLALELKPAQLAPVLQRTLTALRLKATEKGVMLINDLQPNLPEITMDEHRITQVVINLLNNAINFTPPNGTITVQAGEAPGRPDWVQVCISDTGRGIPETEREHIFDRLYQVKTGDATTEHGIGLGLYLCRELVQLHGGSIWVESEVNQGSRFTFVLPKTQDSLRFNVLVMDDDESVRDMCAINLELDYNVRTVEDGVQGLQEMHRQVPDVVVLDVYMPNLDGPGTLREIRKHWGTSVPVIVYSAYTSNNNDLMKKMMEYSPFTLLAKPCQGGQIMETVSKVLRSTDTTIWRRKRPSLNASGNELRNV